MIKKMLSAFGFMAVLIVGGNIAVKSFKATLSSSKPSQSEIDANIIQGSEIVVKQINLNTPTMVDEDTRLDKATVGPGAGITYHFSFPKYSAQDIDSEWVKSNLKPTVKSNVCSNIDLKQALQYGAVYTYAFSGNDGELIESFQFNRNDCGYSKIP